MQAYRFSRTLDDALTHADDALALARRIEDTLAENQACHCLWRPNR